jgi:PAS domain S-box-containing protein
MSDPPLERAGYSLENLGLELAPYCEPALFKAVLAAVGEGILVTGPHLDQPGPLIEYVNPSFARMTGYESHELIGRTPRILQGPNTDRAVLDRLREALTAGQPFRGEAVNYRKDGTEYVVEWLITPVLEPDGRISRWVSAQRDITERRMAEAQQRRLLDEVNHRVNNALASVQSMALQILRGEPCSDIVRRAFLGRLFALSRIHTLLARRLWVGALLSELVGSQLHRRYLAAGGRVGIAGPEVWLRPSAAVALGLTLYELATNAAAHGALSAPTGRVQLAWSISANDHADPQLQLHWHELAGPPVPAPPVRHGFGLRLLEGGLARELSAEVRLMFKPQGLHCELDMPLRAVATDMAQTPPPSGNRG